MKKVILLSSILLLIVFHSQAQHGGSNDKAREVIDRYLDAIGGEDNWKRVQSYRMEAVLTMQGMEFPMLLIQARPNKQRIESTIMGKTMIQGYDGETGWTINPLEGSKEPRRMGDDELAGMKDQKFENEFIDYQKKGTKVSYQGTEEIEDELCHRLKLEFANGLEKVVFISTFYHVPIMERTYVTEGPTKGQAVETFFSDYGEVDGLFMPYQIETRSQGQTISSIVIDRVEYNIAITDALFDFPK
jgi:outer membrane lipoprotein-sorting protein